MVIISSDANAINIWYLPGQLYLRFYPFLDYHYKYMSLCYPNNVWKFQNTSSKSLEDFFPQNLISCTDKLCHSNKLSPKQGWKISHVSEVSMESKCDPIYLSSVSLLNLCHKIFDQTIVQFIRNCQS